MNEFVKKINPDLLFCYWTGHKHRFILGPLPSFNKSSGEEERLDKIELCCRLDPGVFVANRASPLQQNSLTARATFHRAAEVLPRLHQVHLVSTYVERHITANVEYCT